MSVFQNIDWKMAPNIAGLDKSSKEDISVCFEELVYWTDLQFSGDFFSFAAKNVSVSKFLSCLRHFQDSWPVAAVYYSKHKVFVFEVLNYYSNFSFRLYHKLCPLQSPYKGPYHVISSKAKMYLLRNQENGWLYKYQSWWIS